MPTSVSITLKLATPKQTKAACLLWHYSRTVPAASVSFACYEDGKFVGCILYGVGANRNIGNQYGLKQGQVYELLRVALNKRAHKQPTTQYVAISLKLFKKLKPLCQMVVSYADFGAQGHEGIIYKAGNWIYLGDSKLNYLLVNGERVHPKTAYARWGSLKDIPGGYKFAKGGLKKKYVYCYNKDMRRELESKATSFQEVESGAVPTTSLQASLAPK